MLTGIYLTYNQVYKVQIVYNELNTNSAIAMNRLSKNIRQSTNVVETKTVNSTAYTTDSDTLIIELPSIDSEHNIIYATYDYIVYYIDGTQLKSDFEPDVSSSRSGGNSLIAQYVENIVFNYNDIDYDDTDKIEVILSTSKQSGTSVQKLTIQGTSHLRNVE